MRKVRVAPDRFFDENHVLTTIYCLLQSCALILAAGLVVISANPGTDSKAAKPKQVEAAAEKKHDKRGLIDLGYSGDFGGGGFDHGIELGGGHEGGFGGGYGGGFDEGHVKHITITKEVKVPYPAPYPVHVEKKVSYNNVTK